MDKLTKIKLNDGTLMPVMGFGTTQLVGLTGKQAIQTAIGSGYRLIDTAQSYDNEEIVGEAVRESGISRQDLFITTKIKDDYQGHYSTIEALNESLNRLKMSYVDLLLVHWPNVDNFDLSIETWETLIELKDQGKTRSIGVSNFTQDLIQQTIDASGVTPVINQVEFHPFLYQKDLLTYCQSAGIKIEGYSPIFRARRSDNRLLQKLAHKYSKSPSQIILRWQIEHEIIPIPRSQNPRHIKENIDIFDFSLSKDEIKAMDGLDEGFRIIHPAKAPDAW